MVGVLVKITICGILVSDFDCKQASKTDEYLTLFRMGLFGAGYGSGGAKSTPPLLKPVTHILQ